MIVALVIIGFVSSLAFVLSVAAILRTGNGEGTMLVVQGGILDGNDNEDEIGFRHFKN